MSYRELKNKILSKAAGLILEVEKLNDPEIFKQRIEACKSCKMLDVENERCKICTCFIQAKAALKVNKKVEMKINELTGLEYPVIKGTELTHCPLGKWNDKDIANHYRKEEGKTII